MASRQGIKSIRRFGPRYGRGVKLRFGVAEASQRARHMCPYCRVQRVKRVAVGIWQCRKCGNKFTGRAYTLAGVSAEAKALAKADEAKAGAGAAHPKVASEQPEAKDPENAEAY